MDNETFDDGLVHAHHWATEKPATMSAMSVSIGQEADYDDGLVHSHDWASSFGK